MPEITLIAHNIRSAHNVGALFRNAEGFGVKKIILSGYAPYPTYLGDTRLPHLANKITSTIHKTALGAETMVPFAYYESIESVFAELQMPLIALEQHGTSIALPDYSPPEAFALLLGEEVHGIDPALLERCDAILEIPMCGQKESFNVSVAAGIALYALSR